MKASRRSFCRLGVASVPLALLGAPGVLPPARVAAEGGDEFLAYLAEDTRRQCRLAAVPGRERPAALRRLGANIEVAASYLHSRGETARAASAVAARVRARGTDGVVRDLRERWPAFAAAMSHDLHVAVPADLDPAAATVAIERLQKYGCPRFGGVRRCLEREADRFERQAQAAAATTVLVRQVPGSDYGPEGWSAGIADAQLSCYEIGILVAALFLLMDLFPEIAVSLRIPADILGVVYALFCII